MADKKWGFLRETKEKAEKAGIDKETGLHRTGLEEYLKAIFPETHDWVHDKTVPKICGEKRFFRPDYRSESRKLIVEFDGIPHYTSPLNIRKDREKSKFYEDGGYKVVRIPFFIQLSRSVVKRMFDCDAGELFDERIPSLGISGRNTPAFMCPAGIERMAKEFCKYAPEQYKVNIEHLEKENDEELTGVSLLKAAYGKSSSHTQTHTRGHLSLTP